MHARTSITLACALLVCFIAGSSVADEPIALLEYISPTLLGEMKVGDADNDGEDELLMSMGGIVMVSNLMFGGENFTNYICPNHNANQGQKGHEAVFAIGDVDGDGANEVIVGLGYRGAYQHEGYLGIYKYNDTTNDYELVWEDEVNQDRAVGGIAIGDLDGDGIQEFAVAQDYYGRKLQIYDYDAGSWSVVYEVNTGDANDVVIADINRNGFPEVVTALSCYGELAVVAYEFDGMQYSAVFNSDTVGMPTAQYESISVGDPDGDGDLEIVAGSANRHGCYYTEETGLFVIGYNGSSYELEWSHVYADDVRDVLCADMDGDGDDEIVAGCYYRSGAPYPIFGGIRIFDWDGSSDYDEIVTKRFAYFYSYDYDRAEGGVNHLAWYDWLHDGTYELLAAGHQLVAFRYDYPPTGVGPHGAPVEQLPTARNYPNPFNPVTTIEFTVPVTGPVRGVIYSIDGREVRTFVAEDLAQGVHARQWDGTDNEGQPVGSGVYFLRLETAEGATATRKLTLLK